MGFSALNLTIKVLVFFILMHMLKHKAAPRPASIAGLGLTAAGGGSGEAPETEEQPETV